MTWDEALDILDEGKIERFRWLCSEANDNEETREGYRAFMVRKATGQPEPVQRGVRGERSGASELNDSSLVPHSDFVADPWLPLIRACNDYNPACCSNPAPWCTRFNLVPTRERCIECLTADGIGPGNASPALSEKETADGKPDEVDTI